jgi:hypothetical protein
VDGSRGFLREFFKYLVRGFICCKLVFSLRCLCLSGTLQDIKALDLACSSRLTNHLSTYLQDPLYSRVLHSAWHPEHDPKLSPGWETKIVPLRVARVAV